MLLAGRLLREAVLQQSALSRRRRVLPARPRPRRWSTPCWPWPTAARQLVDAGRARRHRGGGRLRPAAAGPGGDRPDDAGVAAARGSPLIARAARGAAAMSAVFGRGRVLPASVELRGPLLVVEGVRGVGWDEFAHVRLDVGGDAARPGAGGRPRPRRRAGARGHGGHGGDRHAGAASPAEPLRIPVGPGWLGRVCNGRGEPLDGGPPVLGRTRAADHRRPAQPHLAGAAGRAGAHRGLRRSTRSPRWSAGRSCRSSRWPACRTWSWPPRSPPRPAPAASRSASSSRRWG